jgi:hypothetical protein
MFDNDCFRHQLQVTFTSTREEAYASLERVTGCARRTGVALMSLRVTTRGVVCHAWLRVGSRNRDAIELLSNRLGSLIGLDDLMCSFDADRAEGGG